MSELLLAERCPKRVHSSCYSCEPPSVRLRAFGVSGRWAGGLFIPHITDLSFFTRSQAPAWERAAFEAPPREFALRFLSLLGVRGCRDDLWVQEAGASKTFHSQAGAWEREIFLHHRLVGYKKAGG